MMHPRAARSGTPEKPTRLEFICAECKQIVVADSMPFMPCACGAPANRWKHLIR